MRLSSRMWPRSGPARALRQAIDGLPMPTRRAMLSAVEADEVIAGAYVDRSGRVCPMLAAHRRGARADGSDFARAWDAFVHARRPRPAPEREVQILRALLQESVCEPEGGIGSNRGRRTRSKTAIESVAR